MKRHGISILIILVLISIVSCSENEDVIVSGSSSTDITSIPTHTSNQEIIEENPIESDDGLESIPDNIQFDNGYINGEYDRVVFDAEINDHEKMNQHLSVYEAQYSSGNPHSDNPYSEYNAEQVIVSDMGEVLVIDDMFEDEDAPISIENKSILCLECSNYPIHVIRDTVDGLPICGVHYKGIYTSFVEIPDLCIGQTAGFYGYELYNNTLYLYLQGGYERILNSYQSTETVVNPENYVMTFVNEIRKNTDSLVTVFYVELTYVVICEWNTDTNTSFRIVNDECVYYIYPIWNCYYLSEDGLIGNAYIDAFSGEGIQIDDSYYLTFLGA